MKEELWKDISGYEGTYQVSNMGRVRRLTFVNNMVQKDKIHVVNPTDNGRGYLVIGLKIDGKRKNKYVHRLVAEAFCENTDGKKYVNHKDHDKHNNMSCNLEWCTQQENVRYSSERMSHPKRTSKSTNTGEKYIRIRRGMYVVSMKRQTNGVGFYKSFNTMEDAVAFRDECARLMYG